MSIETNGLLAYAAAVWVFPRKRYSVETRLPACLRGSSADTAAEVAFCWDEIACFLMQQQCGYYRRGGVSVEMRWPACLRSGSATITAEVAFSPCGDEMGCIHSGSACIATETAFSIEMRLPACLGSSSAGIPAEAAFFPFR